MLNQLDNFSYVKSKNIYENILNNLKLVVELNLQMNAWIYDIVIKSEIIWKDLIIFYEENIKDENYNLEKCVNDYKQKLSRKRLPNIKPLQISKISKPISSKKSPVKEIRNSPKAFNKTSNQNFKNLQTKLSKVNSDIIDLHSKITTLNSKIDSINSRDDNEVKKIVEKTLLELLHEQIDVISNIQIKFKEYQEYENYLNH